MAILEHAARRGWCARPNFERPTVIKPRTVFCTPVQIDALILNAAPHAQALFTFLAGCGTRPSEAFELDWCNVDLGAARCAVEQKQGNWRYFDMPPRVVAALSSLPHRAGPVFRPKRRLRRGADGQMLPTGYQTGEGASGQAEKVFSTAARKAGWPGHWREWTDKHGIPHKQWVSEITLYALRHTWATWHYCRFKDMRRTMEDGGWATLDMVMHYAKLMPESYLPAIEAWMAGGPISTTKSVHDGLGAVNS
ncbi:MAG: tyrosine-type recombinase/integrase [Rhodospirillales bacterium]|nr:tyrosine-type recombinase/integrase [Rhodospirillales bacterium]